MRIAIARALLVLAQRCLGPRRRLWAQAMEGEFAEAVDGGAPLRFAAGCLGVGVRALVAQPEGRFAIAAHVLAVGVVVPMAGLLLWSAAIGFPYLAFDRIGTGVPISGWPSVPVTYANQSGVPWLAAMTALLGVGHALLGWAMLERDWPRVAMLCRLGAALVTTGIAFSAILFPYDPCALPQALAIGIELMAVVLLVEWHRELPDDGQAAR
ncbi:hypothetical protein QLH51_19320 [Sphingomonas sp. 2R-10]|uniref:hypothetical protein n=1 Tax=Sphingomonas sp. 2R-10 TaxID=3045148 RepID=UPI000F77D103|nr:hypothetical protein [Sphingomonas sp. 2R-10]MDJ0278941.1 hypothetical protein [Sphingomonas sp. 2R-10]